MSVATVSPVSIDNLVGFRKRGRVMGSDHNGFIDHKAKKPKTETDLGVEQEEAAFGFGLRFNYIPKNSGLSDDVIKRLRKDYTTNLLLKHKKLHLVLDLDHTLLNTTRIDKMSPEEEYLMTQTEADRSLQNVHIVGSSDKRLMTKLRPNVETFLQEACKMFELSIYTNGNREYALEMVKLLDPGNKMFGGRVISRSESTEASRKGLDVVLTRASAVLILDDKKHMWRDEDRENVLVMPKYHFFRSSCDKYGFSNAKSYSELKTDECNRFGRAYLSRVLILLRHIYNQFFNGVELQGCELVDRDVRLVLKMAKKLTSLEGL